MAAMTVGSEKTSESMRRQKTQSEPQKFNQNESIRLPRQPLGVFKHGFPANLSQLLGNTHFG